MKQPQKSLIFSSNEQLNDQLKNNLSTLGYEAICSENKNAGLSILRTNSIDIILIDIDSFSFEVLNLIREISIFDSNLDIILILEQQKSDFISEYLNEGASDYLLKPVNMDILELALVRAARRTKKIKKLTKEIENFENLVKYKTKELEETNLKLHKAYESLDIFYKTKSEFLFFINHELRTPLTSLAAFKLLDVNKFTDKDQEILEILSDGYSRLDYLVKKALDYFRLMLNIPEIYLFEINIFDLVNSVVKGHEKGLKDKEITCFIDIPADYKLESDKEIIEKIIDIIISNAIKFNVQGGKIQISADVTTEKFHLMITDTGLGLSKDSFENIFYAFAIQNINYHSKGSGLNLPIAKNLLYFISGEIYAESPGINKGTTLHLELPVK